MKKKFSVKEKYRRFKAWRKHVFSSCAKSCRNRIDRFKAWQGQPKQVAPMSPEEHECLNCHDHYTGNYCPRCGQAATTDRFSMKVAAENFADAYGMGERGMFRTMRDLVLRPGYLILDYLRGMRASYFAPFKLFFLLTAVSLLVTHGLNIKGHNPSAENETKSEVQEIQEQKTDDKTATMEEKPTGADDLFGERVESVVLKIVDKMQRFQERFSSIFMLLILMLLSGYLFLFFRHSPNIPDMRYSEFFIALLYITNMYTIYAIVFDFFCLEKLSDLPFFLTLVPLKQMSGYSWRRTILKSTVAVISMAVLLLVLLVLVILAIGLLVKWFG